MTVGIPCFADNDIRVQIIFNYLLKLLLNLLKINTKTTKTVTKNLINKNTYKPFVFFFYFVFSVSCLSNSNNKNPSVTLCLSPPPNAFHYCFLWGLVFLCKFCLKIIFFVGFVVCFLTNFFNFYLSDFRCLLLPLFCMQILF